MAITLTREEAQQVLDALEAEHSAIYGTSQTVKATELLRTRLAQPEPEPVAWGVIASNTGRICQVEIEENEIVVYNPKHIVPLYTAPPQREWQGLTDEEISELIRNTHNTGSFVRAIEAELKEKNT